MLQAIHYFLQYLQHGLKRLQLYEALLSSVASVQICWRSICKYQMENIFPSI